MHFKQVKEKNIEVKTSKQTEEISQTILTGQEKNKLYMQEK